MHAWKRDAGEAHVRCALQVTKRSRVSGSNAPWNLRERDDIQRWAHPPPRPLRPLYPSISTLVAPRAHGFNPRGIPGASQTARNWDAPLNLGPPVIIDACDPPEIRIRSIKTR